MKCIPVVKAPPFQPTLTAMVRQALQCEHRFQVKFMQDSPGELDPLGHSHS